MTIPRFPVSVFLFLVVLLLCGCVGTMTYPTIEPISFKPSGMAPNDFVQVDSLTPTFTWRHPNFAEMDDFAIWRVAPDGSPGETLIFEKNIPGGQYSLTEPLTPGEEYFWSVRPTGSFVWARANYVGVSPLGAAWQNGVPFRIKAPARSATVNVKTPPPEPDSAQTHLAVSNPTSAVKVEPVVSQPEPPNAATVDASALQAPPICVVQTPPQYPFEMRAQKASGVVVVDFLITPEGSVTHAFASHSSRPEFEAAAISAVNKWKFIPGKINGLAVYTHMQVPLIFDINK